MYPRLPLDMAHALAARLRPGASARGDYPLSEHPDLPTALVYTVDDEFFTPEWERFVASQLSCELSRSSCPAVTSRWLRIPRRSPTFSIASR